ncbi:MAG: BrnT family toxin [Silicimonas sp.]|nr:BrnT family toxin [Silicimonas sp.]
MFSGYFLQLEARSDIEDRTMAVGQLGTKVIAVVYTRREDVRRIITARHARRDERERYQALLARRGAKDQGRH